MRLKEYIEPAQEKLDDLLGDVPPEKVAKGLGFVSIAIGLTEIVAPRQLQKTMGIGNGQNTGIMRVLGVREVMHGVDLLSHDDPAPGVWARCAGDMLDGVCLAAAGMKSKKPGGFMAIMALVMPVVIIDHVLAPKLSARKNRPLLSRLLGL